MADGVGREPLLFFLSFYFFLGIGARTNEQKESNKTSVQKKGDYNKGRRWDDIKELGGKRKERSGVRCVGGGDTM